MRLVVGCSVGLKVGCSVGMKMGCSVGSGVWFALAFPGLRMACGVWHRSMWPARPYWGLRWSTRGQGDYVVVRNRVQGRVQTQGAWVGRFTCTVECMDQVIAAFLAVVVEQPCTCNVCIRHQAQMPSCIFLGHLYAHRPTNHRATVRIKSAIMGHAARTHHS